MYNIISNMCEIVTNRNHRNVQMYKPILHETKDIEIDDDIKDTIVDVIREYSRLPFNIVGRIKMLELSILSGNRTNFTNMIDGIDDDILIEIMIADRKDELFKSYKTIPDVSNRLLLKYLRTGIGETSYVKLFSELRLREEMNVDDDVFKSVLKNLNSDTLIILKSDNIARSKHSHFHAYLYIEEIVEFSGINDDYDAIAYYSSGIHDIIEEKFSFVNDLYNKGFTATSLGVCVLILSTRKSSVYLGCVQTIVSEIKKIKTVEELEFINDYISVNINRFMEEKICTANFMCQCIESFTEKCINNIEVFEMIKKGVRFVPVTHLDINARDISNVTLNTMLNKPRWIFDKYRYCQDVMFRFYNECL